MIVFLSILSFSIILIDLYCFKGYNSVFNITNFYGKLIYYNVFWGSSLFFILFFVYGFSKMPSASDVWKYSLMFLVASLFMLIYFPKIIFLVFHLLEDIIHLILIGLKKLGLIHTSINRTHYLSITGIVLSAIPFFLILYGMLIGRFDLNINNKTITSREIPQSFNGLRIIQLSDIHLGSLYGNEKWMQKVVREINALHPDVIVFTGDIVNNVAEETQHWDSIFKAMQAPMGKFAILGNHDYGDYIPFPTENAKTRNLDSIKDFHRKSGFQLLLNESTILRKGDDSIAIIGVENWGEPPFKQYGNLNIALNGVEKVGYKILLSHDPSHWDAQVTKGSNIQLTLSGHTHGMQLGIRLKNWQWSPAKFKYPKWGGLYQKNEQYLFVSTGLGDIGFSGRIGIRPEIVVLDLKKLPRDE